MLRLFVGFFLVFAIGLSAQASEVISGHVVLSPELADKVEPNDTVFIFARAVNGPRMPLAAVRARVLDLPLEFRLDDSMAMAPMARLSGYPQVVVIARISASGGAQAASGDLEGDSGVIAPGTQDLEIVIDRQLP
jgi:cytochrome c-type biogenesis protein CcmH